jgi:TonB family protein
VSGGEVLLEVEVDTDGRVDSVARLRVTPPYTDHVISVVEGWRFKPASRVAGSSREATARKVLVAAVFRPPALYLGTTQGEPPRDVARPSAQTPVLRDVVFPTYPPNGRGSGIVLVEVEVGPAGDTAGLKVVISGGGFDDPALAAVRRWSFDPPKQPEGPMRSYVYAIVGFREPIATMPRRPPALR